MTKVYRRQRRRLCGRVRHEDGAPIGGRHRGRATSSRRCRTRRSCAPWIRRRPLEVQRAAGDLHYRDFLTVALVVPEHAGFPDNWIYVHYPGVKVGRIQNFGSWSPLHGEGRPHLPRARVLRLRGRRAVGVDDDGSSRWATDELAASGSSSARDVERGFVVRMPKAYPVYDEGYQEAVETIRAWLAQRGAERPRRGPQRHAQVQQPGPFDVHGDAHRGEHRRRCPPRHLGR